MLSRYGIFQAALCRRKKVLTHQCMCSHAPPFFFFLFFFHSVFIDFKVQAFQPSAGLWSSPVVTSLQKEEHQSQGWLVLLADGDVIVALLCSPRMHSRRNISAQEPTQQSRQYHPVGHGHFWTGFSGPYCCYILCSSCSSTWSTVDHHWHWLVLHLSL